MKHNNYQLIFRKDKTAEGVAELAPTQGLAIEQALQRTDYELADLIEIREVFGLPKQDRFFPN